jgi:hypothetical protein
VESDILHWLIDFDRHLLIFEMIFYIGVTEVTEVEWLQATALSFLAKISFLTLTKV